MGKYQTLVIFGCLATNIYNYSINLKKILTFISRKKYCEDILYLFFWTLRGYLARHTQSGTINPYCYLQAKSQLHRPAFLDILQIYAKLIFGNLDKPGCTHPSMFICMPKIEFIIHFFFGTLSFKELAV